jgi:hypothetical protein
MILDIVIDYPYLHSVIIFFLIILITGTILCIIKELNSLQQTFNSLFDDLEKRIAKLESTIK